MKKIMAMILALCMVFALCAITASADDDADNYYVDIKYSNVFQPTEWNYKAAEKFAAMVTEKTEGHINVTYYGQNELDCYADSVEQAVNGSLWIGLEEPSLFGDYCPDCMVLVGPMIFTTNEEYNYVMDSEIVEGIKAQLAEENIHILDTQYSFGFRSVCTNKDNVTVPADLKGLKLRSTTAPLFIKTVEALGATAVPMSFTECLSAIQSGVCDGFEGSVSTFVGAGAPYELVKRVALTNHFIATRWLFMPEDLYQSIPTKWRDILDECAHECGEWEQTMCQDEEQSKIQEMIDNYEVIYNDVDVVAFTEACAPVFDWIVEEYGADPELHQQLVDLLTEFRAA